MTRVVLVPSPFVGAESWRPTADVLPNAVVGDYGRVRGPDWYEGVASRVSSHAGDDPWIAVLHSGAGGFAPALAAASTSLAGFVFLDAVLPYPGKSCLENAPEGLRRQLRRLTTDGRLAPWNQWFPEDPTPRLIPDPEVRAAFVRDLPRVPFAFLEAMSAPRSEWEKVPAAYVQLSPVYADTADMAEARGWAVRRADLHHLAMASDPHAVAALINDVWD